MTQGSTFKYHTCERVPGMRPSSAFRWSESTGNSGGGAPRSFSHKKAPGIRGFGSISITPIGARKGQSVVARPWCLFVANFSIRRSQHAQADQSEDDQGGEDGQDLLLDRGEPEGHGRRRVEESRVEESSGRVEESGNEGSRSRESRSRLSASGPQSGGTQRWRGKLSVTAHAVRLSTPRLSTPRLLDRSSESERLEPREERFDEGLVGDVLPAAIAGNADKELVALVAEAVMPGEAEKLGG